MFYYSRLNRAKFHIFSTLTLTAIVSIIVFAYTFVSNFALCPVSFEAKSKFQEFWRPVKSTSIVKPLLSIQERIDEARRGDHGSLRPPFNLTREEQITGINNKFQTLDAFESTVLSRKFDDRVQKFLGSGCRVQFFMTWISPLELFGRREFFAMESLLKSHPDGCLVILSRSLDSVGGNRILKPLIDHGYRVIAVTPDLPILFNQTPAESWLNDVKSGNKDPGTIPLAQNLSNLIRLAVLYMYGGVYLDTDFIVLKDFSGLKNSIGAQSSDINGNWTRLNNAVLIFDKKHPLLFKFIEEFASTFDGNRWGYNGPYLVSRVVEKVAMTKQDLNFTVLPPVAFYPVDWIRIAGFFAGPKDRLQSRWINAKLLQLGEKTYGVHLWNRESNKFKIEEGSIISRLISDQCVLCKDVHYS